MIDRKGSAAYLCENLYGPSKNPHDVSFCFVTGYTCFMDAAGKPEDGPDAFSVCAGFSATTYAWEHFEQSWVEMLDVYEIPYLQMSLLHAKKGFFGEDRWRDAHYTESFLKVANRTIRSHVNHWSASVVRYRDFDEVSRVFELGERFNPYALCGTATGLRLQESLNELHPPVAPVEHIFEEGDDGFGMICAQFKMVGLNEPIRRPGKPQPDKPGLRHYVQLQASDYLAFETRKIANMQQVRIRQCLVGLLSGVKGTAMKYQASNLYEFCEKQQIPRIT